MFKSTCNNSLITIEKKPFFHKAGVENVNADLLDEAPRFISFDVFVRKFKVRTNYLEYYKVVSTLTRYKKYVRHQRNDQTQDATETLPSHKKFCKKERLIKKKRLQHHLKAKVNGWLRT